MFFVYSLLVAVCVWFVLPFCFKQIQIIRLRRRLSKRRVIALTFDDGPSPRLTRGLLKILRDRNAAATFFLLGHKIASAQDTVDQLISDGHEIGSHSYRHLHAWKCDPISVFLDIKNGLSAVRAITDCNLFRAPHGKVTLGSSIQVWLQGCRQSWWTVDSTDTREKPKSIKAIVDQVRSQGGGIILMHDIDRPGKPEYEQFVLDLTQALLDLAESGRFRICRFGDAIKV